MPKDRVDGEWQNRPEHGLHEELCSSLSFFSAIFLFLKTVSRDAPALRGKFFSSTDENSTASSFTAFVDYIAVSTTSSFVRAKLKKEDERRDLYLSLCSLALVRP